MTAEQRARRNEINRQSRKKKKNEVIEMKDKLKKHEDEMKNLRIENAELEHAKVSMGEELQALTAVKDKLESDLEEFKQERDKLNAFLQELLKDKDFKFIKGGDKHDMNPTQDHSPSDEKGHSEKEISAGNLDGGDSEDDNDSKKKTKRAACSASSEGRSGKVPKFACYDARADQRHGSTSDHIAMVRDPYSIAECLRILKTMGDIPYPIVKKATAKFKSQDERETFVGLTADWKREWVKDLENDA
ncbi:hypothetical protein SLEP1_g34134 [Rubroshorea leprosula]|uniref:Uncharacterized protein n=1 Tax=Rubroshorea leprosula TaxID=152421 RepID=A0AAV5KIV5_9ROSI|nr:hypothetical protein SLEP1_g34134 [Rubroshorea leprosula]